MNDMNEIAASAADRTAVRITAVECIPLNVPFKVPFKISTGAARPVVETLIVKVHTDQGVTGSVRPRRGAARAVPRRSKAKSTSSRTISSRR